MGRQQVRSQMIVEEINEQRLLLQKWQGLPARLMQYRASLSVVVVRVQGATESLFVVCGGCTFIQGPVDWETVSFAIESQPEETQQIVAIGDRAANFRVVCSSVTLDVRAATDLVW